MTTPTLPTDLADHVEWFKREVAVPGTFSSLFPTTNDDDLAAALVDGLYRAKLDGWLPGVDADPDSFETSVELTQTAVAIIIVYAAIKFVQNQITNMPTKQRYEAPGGIVSDTERSASVLTERLKELQDERKGLLELRGLTNRRQPTFVRMFDGYEVRASDLPAFSRGPLPALTV